MNGEIPILCTTLQCWKIIKEYEVTLGSIVDLTNKSIAFVKEKFTIKLTILHKIKPGGKH